MVKSLAENKGVSLLKKMEKDMIPLCQFYSQIYVASNV